MRYDKAKEYALEIDRAKKANALVNRSQNTNPQLLSLKSNPDLALTLKIQYQILSFFLNEFTRLFLIKKQRNYDLIRKKRYAALRKERQLKLAAMQKKALLEALLYQKSSQYSLGFFKPKYNTSDLLEFPKLPVSLKNSYLKTTF